MPTIKQTAFRFTEEDLATLGAIQEHTGVISRTETLRLVIRSYARTERIVLPKPKGKSKAKV